MRRVPGEEFTAHLEKRGTIRKLTVHDTPEHNGIAERLNGVLLERVRAMMHGSGMPNFLWSEAVRHAVWLKNRTSTKVLGGMTPHEALAEKPDLSALQRFGCQVWVHHASGSKLDGRVKGDGWASTKRAMATEFIGLAKEASLSSGV
jgi:hypothetical protein